MLDWILQALLTYQGFSTLQISNGGQLGLQKKGGRILVESYLSQSRAGLFTKHGTWKIKLLSNTLQTDSGPLIEKLDRKPKPKLHNLLALAQEYAKAELRQGAREEPEGRITQVDPNATLSTAYLDIVCSS